MIKSLKDLDKVIQLCRKRGVDTIKIGDVEIQMGMEPHKEAKETKTMVVPPKDSQVFIPGGISEDVKISMPDELTEEQLLMWSVAGSEQQ